MVVIANRVMFGLYSPLGILLTERVRADLFAGAQ